METRLEICSLDRVEGDIAILENEDGKQHKLPLEKIPHGALEGDLFSLSSDGTLTFLPEETKKKKEEVYALLQSLWKE